MSFTVDALGLTSPSPGGFSGGVLTSRPHTNCGMGTWGRVKLTSPHSTLFQQGWGGEMLWGVVSPCPASTHRKICLARAHRPSRAIKYYLDAMWSCLASSYCPWDAGEGQCLQQWVQRVCENLCPHPGSTEEGMLHNQLLNIHRMRG